MFGPQSFAVALLMMVASTLCWGSWANSYKGTKNYRFELFYWDYAVGICLISILLAFTLGSLHPGETSFLANLHSADSSNLLFALIGGAIFNVANLLLVAGIEMAGLAVAFPVSIGIALVVGVILSYALQPKGNPLLLALGVLCAVAAVILDGKAYAALRGSARTVSRRAVIVCIVSGVLMGCFAPFVTRALSTGRTLGPYGVAVLFTLGAFLCCFVVNIYFMKRPLVGEPVGWGGFFSAPARFHLLGLLGGLIWGVGTVFNFVAASLTGVAISYAIGQAAPMVAALWGIFVWNEFAGAGRGAKSYLTFMFLSYLAALVFLSFAHTTALGR